MAAIKIDCKKNEDAAARIRGGAADIRSSRATVERVCRSTMRLTALYGASRSIARIDDELLEAAAHMDSLADALEKLTNCYRAAENKVAGGCPDAVGCFSASGSKIDLSGVWDWFRKLLIALKIIKKKDPEPATPTAPEPAKPDPAPEKPTNPEPAPSPAPAPVTPVPVTPPPAEPPTVSKPERIDGEPVSKALEAAQDRYMQNEISRILSESRFSEQTWKASSVEQRKAILSEYLQRVSAVMGLSVGEPQFFYSESQNGYYTAGYYSSGSNTVSINEWAIENLRDSYSLMTTVVHELRHAYQHAACKNPDQFIVSAETIQSWQDSFNNYKSTTGFMNAGMSQKDAFEAYRSQAVEVDARAFAKQS